VLLQVLQHRLQVRLGAAWLMVTIDDGADELRGLPELLQDA
jgi:hypothetical protein